MFNPHFRFATPTGGDLLTELGVRPELVREVDRGRARDPLSRARRGLSRTRLREPRPGLVASPRPARGRTRRALGPGVVALPGRLEVEGGLERLNGRGFGGVTPASGRSEPIVINQEPQETVMAFGKNYAELVGRLGADVTINHLA